MADITSLSPPSRHRRPAPGWLQPGGRMLSALAPGLAAALLEHLFLSPRRTRLREQEKAWLLQAEARPFTLSGGQQIPLYEWRGVARGRGVISEAPLPTVLLAHGMSGRAGQLGGFAAPLVEAGFRVVGFDAPGHGAAPGRRSSLPELTRVIEEVAGHLGPLHAVVAHSNGAAATVAALARGLRARRAVLIAPPIDLGARLDAVAAMLGFPAAVARVAQTRIERRYGLAFSALRGSRLARGLSQPALILHDAADRLVPVSEARELAASWPGAELRLTAGLGHTRILQDPEVIARAAAHCAGALRGGGRAGNHPSPAR